MLVYFHKLKINYKNYKSRILPNCEFKELKFLLHQLLKLKN